MYFPQWVAIPGVGDARAQVGGEGRCDMPVERVEDGEVEEERLELRRFDGGGRKVKGGWSRWWLGALRGGICSYESDRRYMEDSN